VLKNYDGHARVIGGGTDILVEARRGLRRPFEAMVDASGIAGLGSISHEQDYIVIGCGVTHTQIVSDERIVRYGTCLTESCSVIGGPQVRNTGTLAGNVAHALPAGDGTIGLLALGGEVGTLAGNVAHALPAGDGTIGLLALGGEVEIASTTGTRWMPVKDTFLGPGKSVIDRHREVLTRLRFTPTGADEGSAFHRVMRPQGLCLPIISMAARLKIDGDTIVAASIGMGPVGPIPWFAEPVAAFLIGGPTSTEQYEKAADVALDNVTLRASKYRATREYRATMIRTYLPIILARAAERAGASQ